jgi:hypothetical protein
VATSLDWLAQGHDICPRASRCVLISYGDAASYPAVRRALVLGQVDSYFLRHVGDPEERGGLPAVLFSDHCLADPTNVQIAEMLGARTEPDAAVSTIWWS